jgi:hypothetical protein
VGEGEKLFTYFNSALKVLLGTDIFPCVPKKKLNFVAQCNSNAKGKAIPLQVWTDSEGSRRLRLPDFKTIGTSMWQG